jgi:hypothetical protein
MPRDQAWPRWILIAALLCSAHSVCADEPEARGGALAEQPAAHVGLGVEGVPGLAPAQGVDVGDGQPIGPVRGGEDLAPGRDDHAAVAAHRHDQVDEVLRGPRAECGQADVVVADGRAAERGVEHDVGPSQGRRVLLISAAPDPRGSEKSHHLPDRSHTSSLSGRAVSANKVLVGTEAGRLDCLRGDRASDRARPGRRRTRQGAGRPPG